MPQVDLVVIGASAGGLPALITIVSALPPDFPAAVLIVVHTGKTGDSYLPQILANKGRVPVLFAAHGAAIRTGCVYVAPPDSHLVVLRGGADSRSCVALAKMAFGRPSIPCSAARRVSTGHASWASSCRAHSTTAARA